MIAALTHYNHRHSPNPDPAVHARVMACLAVWALAAVVSQGLLRAGFRTRWVRPAWLAADVLMLSTILRLLDAAGSTLVAGYPLLVAASGLWFRVELVWFTTILAEAAYAALLLDASARGMPVAMDQWPNIFIAALLVTGFVVAQQVRRLWALSFYYEHRPIT